MRCGGDRSQLRYSEIVARHLSDGDPIVFEYVEEFLIRFCSQRRRNISVIGRRMSSQAWAAVSYAMCRGRIDRRCRKKRQLILDIDG